MLKARLRRLTALALVTTGVAYAGGPYSASPAAAAPTADVAHDSVTFSGGSAAVHTFGLVGGSYDVNIVAQYDQADDVNLEGRCLFSGYINGPHALHLPFGGPAAIVPPIVSVVSPVLLLPAGSYLLDVLVPTDCAWTITILDLGMPVFTKTGHHLLPMPLGHGMCPATQLADGSVEGQVDLYDTTCAKVAATLGPGADVVQGADFSLDGWKCQSTAEGAGSEWAGGWEGTYYTFDCVDADGQAAFNWGRHYTYR